MSENSANVKSSTSDLTKWFAFADILVYMANQYLKHKAESEGISTDEALNRAKTEYELAKQENEELKQLGH